MFKVFKTPHCVMFMVRSYVGRYGYYEDLSRWWTRDFFGPWYLLISVAFWDHLELSLHASWGDLRFLHHFECRIQPLTCPDNTDALNCSHTSIELECCVWNAKEFEGYVMLLSCVNLIWVMCGNLIWVMCGLVYFPTTHERADEGSHQAFSDPFIYSRGISTCSQHFVH